MIRKYGLWLLFISIFFSITAMGKRCSPPCPGQNWWWVLWLTRCAGIIFIVIIIGMEKVDLNDCSIRDFPVRTHSLIICLLIPQWVIPAFIRVRCHPFNGITGNDWTDQLTGARVYCTEDSTVQTVGAAPSPGWKNVAAKSAGQHSDG